MSAQEHTEMPARDLRRTERSTLHRIKERASYDRETIYAILDEGLICHVGFIAESRSAAGEPAHAQPFVIPTSYARCGDELILHGSVASRMMKRLAEGVDVCVTVTHLDGLVLARSAFNHSMNYRSVVIFGKAKAITDPEEKLLALNALVEHLVPGRSADARGASPKEAAATEVLSLPLEEASAKIRTGPPGDDRRDMDLDVWAGVVPLRLAPGTPITAEDLKEGLAVPEYASSYERPGRRPR